MFSELGVQSAGGCSRALGAANTNAQAKAAIASDLVTNAPLGFE
jgi:hypothetical protein